MSGLGYVLSSIWNEESNKGQRLRRVALFAGWQFWKRTVGRPLDARLFNGRRIRVWPDCDTSPAALYYSLPNSRCLSLLRACLKGGTFVDVGANVGLVTLLVADKISHAILFEPHPAVAERARANLRMNGLSYEVVAEALSDMVGTVDFENAGPGSCNRTVEGFTTSMPTIRVERTTFDDFLRTHQANVRPIDAVKIDVEGHENSVLRGMKGCLRDYRPRLVMFEYLARTDISQALATFREINYCVFEATGSGNRRITASGVKPLQDLFACPVESAEEFGI